MSPLFQPLQLGGLTLPNRIVIAPMCQYSAEEGSATDWHMIHLGHLALSGAGMLVIEATAVSAVGRISPGDLGRYSDANEAARQDVHRTLLEVAVDNHPAQKLYATYDFEPVGIRRGYYQPSNTDALVMMRDA